MAEMLTGGCQCRRIRYTVRVADDAAYLCHCGYCRRATGGAFAALKSVAQADVIWESDKPDWYRSSPIAHRPFCATCGTPLGFAYLDGEAMDLTVGSFDDPRYFRPTSQFSIETALAAWAHAADLPGTRLDEYPALVKRWKDACGKLPE